MYSQFEEEHYILEAVGHIPAGRFLDIGAYHPTVFSNTRALYERGWSGVMVEPSPEPFVTLLREYGDDPRVELVQAAVTPSIFGMLHFHATADATSTSDSAIFEKWKDIVKFNGSFWAGAVPLHTLPLRFGLFDFVNFDAEGVSVQLFQALFSEFSWDGLPSCVCVEYDDALDVVRSVAKNEGYSETYLNGTNIVLVRE